MNMFCERKVTILIFWKRFWLFPKGNKIYLLEGQKFRPLQEKFEGNKIFVFKVDMYLLSRIQI